MKECGITVTHENLQILYEKWQNSEKACAELVQLVLEKRMYYILPFLLFTFKNEVSSHIVQAIELENGDLPEHIPEMLDFIHKHLECLETELVKKAIQQDTLAVARKFLEVLEIRSPINVAELLESTALCYNPDLLHKMLEQGADARSYTKTNPIEVVLRKDMISTTKLKVIHVLLNNKNGMDVTFKLEGTTIIHEVLELILESATDNTDILQKICKIYPFKENENVVNREGQTPWHLALNAKRRTGLEICKVLYQCPIDPSCKDNNGRRADHGKRNNDERVILLKRKEEEMMPEKPKKNKGNKKKREKPKEPSPPPEERGYHEDKLDVPYKQPPQECSQTKVDSECSAGLQSVEERHNVMENIKLQLNRVYAQDGQYFQAMPALKAAKDMEHNKPVCTMKSTDEYSDDLQMENQVTRNKHPVEKIAQKSDKAPPPFDFDQQPWEIECSEEVMKMLSGRKHGDIRPLFLKKLEILAQGEFSGNKKHCKLVFGKGLELYETRLTEQARIIWQIAVQFSARCTQTHYVFSEVIRVWDVVFDHDNIHRAVIRCVKSIETNMHSRGHLASSVVKLNLKDDETRSIAKHVSDGKRYPRWYICDNPKGGQASQVVDYMYIPPIHPEENQYNIAPLFSLSTSMIKHMLEGGDIERAFPYKEWPEEHDIINMREERSILLLGRSGTGKTTCCFYRLWNEFKAYWSTPTDPQLELPPKQFPRNHFQTKSMKLTEEECPVENEKPEAPAATNECCSTEDECSTEESTFSSSPCMDHLHQVFITKNYVLCSRLRKQFYKFSAVEECAKKHMSFRDEDLPHDFTRIDDLAYPLFLTARQFHILLDFSIHDGNYFFERDESGKLMQKVVSSDYDHEDPDICYDLEDSDDEEGIVYHELYPTAQGKRKPRHEVTASYFTEKIWPKDPSKTFNMSPLLVWMEIKSFIKGSKEAIESECGYLLRREYIELGRKRAPNFPGNREKVYELFEIYKQYFISHKWENLFDECDLVHNLFQRLKKQKDRQWAFHSVYIDEVQDFTQGELWLTLHTCQDPNGFFLTGDTAQSIMSGVSFRFEDIKTIFHCLKQCLPKMRIVVPEVQHLVTNFRSHSGILCLAASITDILKHFFPTSFDHENLPRDEGLVAGPVPLFLHSCPSSDLAMLLAGNRRTCSSIDFGAHQAILVRNQKAKEELPSDLSSAIVLTIFESKGLEFDDVLLYNFFTDSEVC